MYPENCYQRISIMITCIDRNWEVEFSRRERAERLMESVDFFTVRCKSSTHFSAPPTASSTDPITPTGYAPSHRRRLKSLRIIGNAGCFGFLHRRRLRPFFSYEHVSNKIRIFLPLIKNRSLLWYLFFLITNYPKNAHKNPR